MPVGQVPASICYEYERADTAAMQKLPAPLPFPSRCMDGMDEGEGLSILAMLARSPVALQKRLQRRAADVRRRRARHLDGPGS